MSTSHVMATNSVVDRRARRHQHVGMSEDESDDEPIVDDKELTSFERVLFTAIRESRKLDAEIDEEYRQLTHGDYDHPAPPEGSS